MMTMDGRRITLVARGTGMPARDWDFSNPMGNRIVFVDALPFLSPAINQGVCDSAYDLERVIIDGTATAAQFLELLTALPPEFLGDLLLITREGRGFLSSMGRGDGRVLYSLTAADLEFYLRTSSLLWADSKENAQMEQAVVTDDQRRSNAK